MQTKEDLASVIRSCQGGLFMEMNGMKYVMVWTMECEFCLSAGLERLRMVRLEFGGS